MEFVDWLTWFALVPAGAVLIFGTLVYFWTRTILLTPTRRWLVTLAICLIFVIVELIIIAKFAYVVPD